MKKFFNEICNQLKKPGKKSLTIFVGLCSNCIIKEFNKCSFLANFLLVKMMCFP
jgi:hypothetical protein